MARAKPIDTTEAPVGICYSGGTSSRWLVESILNGTIKRPEHVAVFTADTGDEHEWTYEDIDVVEEKCKREGVPFVRCADPKITLSGNLLAVGKGAKRADTPPLFTENQGGGTGRLKQQCTKRFKTSAIRRAQNVWLKSIKKPKRITTWIGFALDEMHRANKAVANADVQWATLAFPAIKLGVTRSQQRAELVKNNGAAPRFSMCVICPFKDPERWRQTTETDLAKAIVIDEFVRHGLAPAGVDEPCFLTNRLIPIESLVRNGDPQASLPGFEPAGCDAGMCFL